MSIESNLMSFRAVIRKNSKVVIDDIIHNDISLIHNQKRKTRGFVCMFCSSNKEITKEHVLPRWTYENDSSKEFTTDINGHHQRYNKATIPACFKCNNDKLNSLEVYINDLFSRINLTTTFFRPDELENIIRWFEIIDYKFQVLNVRKRYLKNSKHRVLDQFWNLPLSVLSRNLDYDPTRVVSEIRSSSKRMTIKNKKNRINSLLLLKSIDNDFLFFHTMGEFIFIGLPQHKLAFFYFFEKTFDTNELAQSEAKKIVDQVYKSS